MGGPGPATFSPRSCGGKTSRRPDIGAVSRLSVWSLALLNLLRVLPDSLGTRESTLHVFRKSPVELRLVTTTRDSANPGYLSEKGSFLSTSLNSRLIDEISDMIVNTDITQVIPAYAAPSGESTGHNLLLSNRHVQDLRWQYLKSAEGLDNVLFFAFG